MEGVLGEIFQNYRVPPPPAFILVQLQDNLSSCLNCLNRFIVKVYSITVPNWELSFTVSVVPKLDRLDKLCRRRQWHPTPVLLPGKSHGRRALVGYSPWGCKELDTTEWLPFLSFYYSRHYSIVMLLHKANLLALFSLYFLTTQSIFNFFLNLLCHRHIAGS